MSERDQMERQVSFNRCLTPEEVMALADPGNVMLEIPDPESEKRGRFWPRRPKEFEINRDNPLTVGMSGGY